MSRFKIRLFDGLYQQFVFVLLLLLFSTLNAAELPMAVYTTRDDVIMQNISALRDTLGINFIYGTVDAVNTGTLKTAGFDLIMWGGAGVYDQLGPYSGESYFVVQASDSTSFPSFSAHHGTPSGNYWTNDDGTGAFLQGPLIDSLWFLQFITSKFDSHPRRFHAQMRMKIDTAGVTIGEPIGTIYVHRIVDSMIVDTTSNPPDTTSIKVWEQRGAIPILADSALMTGNMVEEPPDNSTFTLGDSTDYQAWLMVKYAFSSSGNMKVYLDSLKCYSDRGRLLVETNYFDSDIYTGVTRFPESEIDYWWLCDEPRFDYLRPWGRVRSEINIPGRKTPSSAVILYLISKLRR